MSEICKNCGGDILLMCQQFTGFCCAYCEETYEVDE